MPRLPRFVLLGHPQHVIVRGNNRSPIFCADQDYSFYLDKLEQGCNKHQCDLHAYVLMTNHVHLLITPHKPDGISKVMQMVGRYYVQYFNRTYRRTGTLWEGRYKATLIDSDLYALTCYQYIELNPVRANMMDHPAEYPWSSYRYNALGYANPMITPHSLYLALGKNNDARQSCYRDLFAVDIEPKTLAAIREMTNKSWVLGSDYFKETISQMIERPVIPKAKGGDRKSKAYRQGKTDV